MDPDINDGRRVVFMGVNSIHIKHDLLSKDYVRYWRWSSRQVSYPNPWWYAFAYSECNLHGWCNSECMNTHLCITQTQTHAVFSIPARGLHLCPLDRQSHFLNAGVGPLNWFHNSQVDCSQCLIRRCTRQNEWKAWNKSWQSALSWIFLVLPELVFDLLLSLGTTAVLEFLQHYALKCSHEYLGVSCG